LTVTVFLPADEANWEIEVLKRKADEVMSRLEIFLPFLEENIVYYDLDQSIDLSIACRKLVTPKYHVKNNLFTSFSAKSNKTRYRHIYLTGASLMADAGFDAEILSGKNAAWQVLNAMELRHET
jgi:hypothetical protein